MANQIAGPRARETQEQQPREVPREPLRVLFCDVGAPDAALVLNELQRMGRPVQYEIVATAEATRAALVEKRWNVVISEWSAPELHGRAALDMLRELRLDLPLIVMSEGAGEEHAVAIRAGAHDCVAKSQLDRLPPIVERELDAHGKRAAGRQTEEARRATEVRMRRMVEAASVGMWFAGVEGKTTFMNQRLAHIFGLTADEAARATISDFVDPDHRPSFSQRIAERNAGVSGSHEAKFCRKDGSTGWGAFESTPLYDEAGDFEGVFTIMTDATERKRSQDSHREAELRFRCLYESQIVAVSVSDRTGVILDANDTFLTMLGYRREDLAAGLSSVQLTPFEWRAVSAAASDELQAGRSAAPFEKEYLRKDGVRVPVLVGSVVLDEARFLDVVTDLTSRKNAEQVNVRLAEQLRQSQKMDAVGKLAGGVAHDFNNMLSVVLSYCDLMIGDLNKDDPMRSDVEEVRRAGQRAADLTRQLLMFSRQQVVEPKILDLNEVLLEMDRMLRRVVGERVELKSIGGSKLRVCVDPGSIEQAIVNLVINARDAMSSGGKLTMETTDVLLDEEFVAHHHGAAVGAHVMLSVTDTGCGMDRATQARIFEPFFTTKERGKGTGLGLATVFGIVQQSRGTIWVYSEPGVGTSIKIYLPSAVGCDSALPSTTPAVTLRGTETILLVEDEAQVRAVATGILRRHGYTVLAPIGPIEALQLVRSERGPIDLLLSDVVMPKMSGPELATSLCEQRPGLKVLFMSGYTDDSAIRHGLVDGTHAFLEKPLTVETLTRKVREALDDARERRSRPG